MKAKSLPVDEPTHEELLRLDAGRLGVGSARLLALHALQPSHPGLARLELGLLVLLDVGAQLGLNARRDDKLVEAPRLFGWEMEGGG